MLEHLRGTGGGPGQLDPALREELLRSRVGHEAAHPFVVVVDTGTVGAQAPLWSLIRDAGEGGEQDIVPLHRMVRARERNVLLDGSNDAASGTSAPFAIGGRPCASPAAG